MKNIKFIFIIILGLLVQPFLFCEGTQETIEEVTIKADLNLQLEGEKPKLIINFDKNDILKNPIELEKDVFIVTPSSLNDISPALPTIIFSKNTISPGLIDIIKEPILNFKMKPFPNFNVKRWRINITDAKGELFATISGKNALPSVIQWSGRNNKNEMIIPGKWYSYNLVVSDEFGDEYTIQGENFTCNGIFYPKDKLNIASLSLSELFDIENNKDTLVINKDGEKLLKEALDIIKDNYTNPIKIVIYDGKEQIGLKRGQKILQYLISNLYIQDIKINLQFIPSYISDYRVDIEIYNKK